MAESRDRDINFLPGIPFDGGWAVSAGIYWFNGDRESGMALARSVGGFISLAMVLLGAWRGLTTNSWIEALALVLSGLGRQRCRQPEP